MISEELTDQDTRSMWLAYAYAQYGSKCLYAMLQQLKGGGDLAIDPSAWDNTMAALEWTAAELAAGRAQVRETITEETVEHVRRLRVLGSEALSGGERSPELLPLTERCLVAMYGQDWTSLMKKFGHGFSPE